MKKTEKPKRGAEAKLVRNVERFKLLKNNLGSLVFEEITEETPKDFGFKKINPREGQISFLKKTKDYCIVVHTSFDPSLGESGEFTSKGGNKRVLITNKSGKVVYFRRFNKSVNMDNFVKNLFYEAAFLLNRLKLRLVKKSYCFRCEIRQTKTKTFWVSPTGKRYFGSGYIPEHLKNHFDILRGRARDYQKRVYLKKAKDRRLKK